MLSADRVDSRANFFNFLFQSHLYRTMSLGRR